jgi:hypothetical protein
MTVVPPGPRSSARCRVLSRAHMPAYGRSLRPCIARADRARIDERHYVRASKGLSRLGVSELGGVGFLECDQAAGELEEGEVVLGFL